MEKGIKNANAFTCKLELALTRAFNERLKVTKKKRQKKEKTMEKWKTEAMAVRRQRAKRAISLFREKQENYESDTKDKMDPN